MRNLKTKLLLVLFTFIVAVNGQSPFVTVWKTDNPGSTADNQILFPAYGDYEYSWLDLADPSNSASGSASGTKIFDFPHAGTYQLIVTAVGDEPFHRFELNNQGDKEKILGVANWGHAVWSSFENAFYGAKYMIVTAADAPNLSQVTSMKLAFASTDNFDHPVEHWDMSNVEDITGMFANTKAFNQPLNGWDVSNITNMAEAFANAYSFNQPLDQWDVSKVYRMSTMFFGAKEFDQPLENWNMSNVNTVEGMFAETPKFNQPLEGWDMSNVETISGMFYQTGSFNQPLNGWDTSSVLYSAGMFDGAVSFNQPLNNWDTSNILVMATMFANNSVFNQPLDNWDVSNVWLSAAMFMNATAFDQNLKSWKFNNLEIADAMFNGSGVSCENYSYLLHEWSQNSDLAQNVLFGAVGMKYSPEVADSRSFLIDEMNWNISGDQLGECSIGLGLNEISQVQFNVFPNPAQSHITVSGDFLPVHFQFFDSHGRVVKSIDSTDKTIYVGDLPDGIYLLQIKSSKGEVLNKKIIVKK